MVLILFNLYKPIVSYDRTKMKKVGSIFAPTWLIFAGPVTYSFLIFAILTTILKQVFAKLSILMHSYYHNNIVTLLNTEKS